MGMIASPLPATRIFKNRILSGTVDKLRANFPFPLLSVFQIDGSEDRNITNQPSLPDFVALDLCDGLSVPFDRLGFVLDVPSWISMPTRPGCQSPFIEIAILWIDATRPNQ